MVKGTKKKCYEKGSEQLLLCRIIPPYNFQCKCLQQKCVKCVKNKYPHLLNQPSF